MMCTITIDREREIYVCGRLLLQFICSNLMFLLVTFDVVFSLRREEKMWAEIHAWCNDLHYLPHTRTRPYRAIETRKSKEKKKKTKMNDRNGTMALQRLFYLSICFFSRESIADVHVNTLYHFISSFSICMRFVFYRNLVDSTSGVRASI